MMMTECDDEFSMEDRKEKNLGEKRSTVKKGCGKTEEKTREKKRGKKDIRKGGEKGDLVA